MQGKAFFSQKHRQHAETSPVQVAHSAQGYVKFRRREAAILTQLSSIYRLKRSGRSGLIMNTDEANAFGSTKPEVLSEQVPKLVSESDVHFGDQRNKWSAAELPASDRQLVVRNGVGSLMGDEWSVKAFLAAHEGPSNSWNFEHCFILPPAESVFFNTASPIAPDDHQAKTDLSFSKFADSLKAPARRASDMSSWK